MNHVGALHNYGAANVCGSIVEHGTCRGPGAALLSPSTARNAEAARSLHDALHRVIVCTQLLADGRPTQPLEVRQAAAAGASHEALAQCQARHSHKVAPREDPKASSTQLATGTILRERLELQGDERDILLVEPGPRLHTPISFLTEGVRHLHPVQLLSVELSLPLPVLPRGRLEAHEAVADTQRPTIGAWREGMVPPAATAMLMRILACHAASHCGQTDLHVEAGRALHPERTLALVVFLGCGAQWLLTTEQRPKPHVAPALRHNLRRGCGQWCRAPRGRGCADSDRVAQPHQHGHNGGQPVDSQEEPAGASAREKGTGVRRYLLEGHAELGQRLDDPTDRGVANLDTESAPPMVHLAARRWQALQERLRNHRAACR